MTVKTRSAAKKPSKASKLARARTARQNGRKSAGPKTSAGKERVRYGDRHVENYPATGPGLSRPAQ
jgi:hypothetical protein